MRTAAVCLFAIIVCGPCLVAAPTRCEEPMTRGNALEKAGQKTEAVVYFTKAIHLCTPPNSEAEKLSLAKAHIRVGVSQYASDPAQALLHFRKAVDLDPGNLAGSLDLAAALTALQSYREAVTVAEK